MAQDKDKAAKPADFKPSDFKAEVQDQTDPRIRQMVNKPSKPRGAYKVGVYVDGTVVQGTYNAIHEDDAWAQFCDAHKHHHGPHQYPRKIVYIGPATDVVQVDADAALNAALGITPAA